MSSPADRSPDAPALHPEVVWLNGVLIEEGEAGISPFDHGLLTGDGVFETLVTHARRPFAPQRHYDRLTRSASAFGLSVPTREEVWAALESVIAANPHLPDRMRVRVTVTGGKAPPGSEKGTQQETVLIAAAAPPVRSAIAKIVCVPWCRNERGALTGVKTTSYGENVVALSYARGRGASEAIFGNTLGNLCEGSGSNIFLVRNGVVMTPPLASGCLAGVTRAIVLELCARLGIEAQEVDVPLGILEEVEEAFLTSTLRDVQAIGEIEGREMATDGATTRRLSEAFQELIPKG